MTTDELRVLAAKVLGDGYGVGAYDARRLARAVPILLDAIEGSEAERNAARGLESIPCALAANAEPER